MVDMQKLLITIGIVLALIGLAWPWISTLPLGRLPGDIIIERDNFTFYIPITTMIIISLVISLLIWLFRH
jgi:hypothetical protein